MMISRIAAIILILAATLWIGSGVIGRADRSPSASATPPAEAPRFRVTVMAAQIEPHARAVVLSGRTEADKRANATTRAAGTIVDLKVRRGALVKTGDTMAVLSDEARNAQVNQASARLEQRRAELRARLQLIERGVLAEINRPQLEAELRSAEAGLAVARAEREKVLVLAPLSGVVNTVPVERGQAVEAGHIIGEVIALDPMLAVVEVSERQLAGLRVGDRASVRLVTGETADGAIRFISRSASAQTRTYRVDVEIPNPGATLADGVTCSVTLRLAPSDAARLPRSALTFSSDGRLIVRTVGTDGKVGSVPVTIVEDASDHFWLAGIANGTQVIVQGQDFVADGQVVEPVRATAASR